jgi:hypothetical protein
MPRSAKMNRLRAIEHSVRMQKVSRALGAWRGFLLSTPCTSRAARVRRCFASLVDEARREREARRVISRMVWLRQQPTDYVLL